METKQLINSIKKELAHLGFAFAAISLILLAIYYKEPVLNTLKLSLNLFVLFFIPGFFLLLFLKDKFEFTERLVAGSILAMGVSGVLSYLLSLAGLHLRYHGYINLILLTITGILLLWLKEMKKQ